METPPSMSGCIFRSVVGWVGGLIGGTSQITKNQINLDLIEIDNSV